MNENAARQEFVFDGPPHVKRTEVAKVIPRVD